MSEVKRWAATELVRFEDGLIMERRGTDRFSSNPAAAFIAVVLASDYDTLKAERDALERDLRQARIARDLAVELARYFTSGNEVPVERITVDRASDLFLILQEVLPNWDYHPFTSAALKGTP